MRPEEQKKGRTPARRKLTTAALLALLTLLGVVGAGVLISRDQPAGDSSVAHGLLGPTRGGFVHPGGGFVPPGGGFATPGGGFLPPAAGTPDAAPVTGVMIFGQSNAHGRANPTLLDPGVNGTAVYSNATIDTVDTFTWPSSTVPRQDLQPFGAGVPGMGVELSLGRFLVQSGLADSVLPMSKMGVDGSTIANWRNGTNLGHFDDYWDAQEAATGKLISDAVFIQGEADATAPAQSSIYESELTALMTSIRSAHPGLKRIFIIRLNNAATGAAITPSDRDAVRAAQAAWVAANPGVGFLVDVDGVSLDPADNVHYLANGYWGMGWVIGQAMAQAIGQPIADEPGLAGTTYVRQFRGAMSYTSTVSGLITVVPTPANVGDRQYLIVNANALSLAISLPTAAGFTQIGSTVDSNAGGVHVMLAIYQRTYDGTQGSPIVDSSATQQRRGAYIYTVAHGGDVDASATSVTNANTTAVTIPSVTTTAANSLVTYVDASFSSTDNPLSNIACANLSDEVLIQESRISNGSKIALIAGHLVAAGASGTCTATHSVNSNQSRFTMSHPPN